jgi:predicted nuclease of predicted toxin-antitoxin system
LILWLGAQLSPALAPWLRASFSLDAFAVRDVGLRDSEDQEIFEAAKRSGAVVMTKDMDFVFLLARFGPPPQIIWLRCGNTSNAFLKELLARTLPNALEVINAGESLVEVTTEW